MADQETEYLSAVNSVIRVCRDAEQAFHGAAEAAKDPGLKSYFAELSAQ